MKNVFGSSSVSTSLRYLGEIKSSSIADSVSVDVGDDDKDGEGDDTPTNISKKTSEHKEKKVGNNSANGASKDVVHSDADAPPPPPNSFNITNQANRMIGAMIEAEVKRIVSSVKSRADIHPSSKRKKPPALSAVPEPDAAEGSGKKSKKPRRRRINLNDIQEVCGEWNRNVDVYALAIEATKEKGKVGELRG